MIPRTFRIKTVFMICALGMSAAGCTHTTPDYFKSEKNSNIAAPLALSNYVSFIPDAIIVEAYAKDYMKSSLERRQQDWMIIPELQFANNDEESVKKAFRDHYTWDKTTQDIFTRTIAEIASTPEGMGILSLAYKNAGQLNIIGNIDEENGHSSKVGQSGIPDGLIIINGGLANTGYNCNGKENTPVRMSIERILLHEIIHKAFPHFGEDETIKLANGYMKKYYNECMRQDHGSVVIMSDGQFYIATKSPSPAQ